jgi:hypothetical protein
VQLELNGIGHRLGKPRASVAIGERDYSVWLWRSMGGHDPAGLPSYVFSDGQANRAGIIDVRALLDYLLAQRLVSADDWIACCELGNEVSGGHGTTWVKRFDVEIEND